MKAKLKIGEFEIGNRIKYYPRNQGEIVEIVECRDAQWGEQYKIAGCNDWFQKCCFEYFIENS